MADARKEVTPQGYPSPQVEVNTARDIGPPAAPQPSTAPGAPDKNAGAIDADFVEMGDGQSKPSLGQRFLDWVRSNHADQPSLGAQLGAMGREAVKDVRQTMNESFFGKGEHTPEMGTPMNPTPQNITEDLGNFHGYDPTEFVRGNAPEQDRGRSR